MCVTDSTKSEETIHTNDSELPLGMGYKSCWMVVEGASQKAELCHWNPGERVFYETEEFLEKCKDFPRVYVYMTHRVSETYGFALKEYDVILSHGVLHLSYKDVRDKWKKVNLYEKNKINETYNTYLHIFYGFAFCCLCGSYSL